MTVTRAKKAELVVLSALFLAPAAVIWTHCAQDATLFALHPALNALAMLVCTPSGLYLILERKHVADHATRVWMTKLHLFVNVLAALLLSIAGVAVFVAKRAAQERHFVSPHSWAAMTVGLLFTLNILQGLLLTFEGKRVNWQWRDETHGLVGTLIYIGSAVAMVFGLDSAGDAHFGGPDGVFRLKVMLVIAHAALLGKLLFMPKTGGSAAPLTSPPSPQQTKKKVRVWTTQRLHPSLTQARSKTAGNRYAGLAPLYNQQIDPHNDGEQDRAARAQRALPRAVRHDRRAGGAGAVALRAAPGSQRARVPRVLPSIGVCDARTQGVVGFPDACDAGEGAHVLAALGSCSDGRRRRGRVLGQGGEPEATFCVDALVDRRCDFHAVHAQHARGNTFILKACIWSLTDVHYVLAVHMKGLGTTFGGKKTSWQWKNPGHRIGGMLTFVLGGAASVYGVYSGGWGQAMLGADKQLQVSGLITAAYALLFVKALTTRAAKIPTQKKQD